MFKFDSFVGNNLLIVQKGMMHIRIVRGYFRTSSIFYLGSLLSRSPMILKFTLTYLFLFVIAVQ